MFSELVASLPVDKHDTEKAENIVALGYPIVEPILPAILEWVQDANWPVARVFLPFLATIGASLAPFIRIIFKTNDEVWKYWILNSIVSLSPDLAQLLEMELKELASSRKLRETEEGLDVLARQILLNVYERKTQF